MPALPARKTNKQTNKIQALSAKPGEGGVPGGLSVPKGSSVIASRRTRTVELKDERESPAGLNKRLFQHSGRGSDNHCLYH